MIHWSSKAIYLQVLLESGTKLKFLTPSWTINLSNLCDSLCHIQNILGLAKPVFVDILDSWLLF